jgi:hypothetical protein
MLGRRYSSELARNFRDHEPSVPLEPFRSA